MTPPKRVVTLLTQENCSLCDQAKVILHKISLDHPLILREVRLDSAEGREMAARARMLFAPGVLLDRAPFGHGRLSEKKLRRALAIG